MCTFRAVSNDRNKIELCCVYEICGLTHNVFWLSDFSRRFLTSIPIPTLNTLCRIEAFRIVIGITKGLVVCGFNSLRGPVTNSLLKEQFRKARKPGEVAVAWQLECAAS
jgi:hypothetical protein